MSVRNARCNDEEACVSLLVKRHSKCFCNDTPKQIHDVWHSPCRHYLVLWIDYGERNQCDLHRGSFGRTEQPHMGSSKAECPGLETVSLLTYAAPNLQGQCLPAQNHVSFVRPCSHNRVGQPLRKNLQEATASVIPDNDTCIYSVATRVDTIPCSANRPFIHCPQKNTSLLVTNLLPSETWNSGLEKFEGCLTVHLPHEIIWNANLMQQGNFIDIFLARHVSGTYAHHQEH